MSTLDQQSQNSDGPADLENPPQIPETYDLPETNIKPFLINQYYAIRDYVYSQSRHENARVSMRELRLALGYAVNNWDVFEKFLPPEFDLKQTVKNLHTYLGVINCPSKNKEDWLDAISYLDTIVDIINGIPKIIQLEVNDQVQGLLEA